MKFRIEKFRRECDDDGLYYRDVWDDMGVDDVLVDSDTKTLMIGCKDSGLHLFLQNMFNFSITYHYIELDAFSTNKDGNPKHWKLRLSVPIKNGNDNGESS